MRFMVMVYTDPKAEERPFSEWMAFHEKYGSSGVIQIAERLHGVDTAKQVRVNASGPDVQEGAVGAALELTGIYVFECPDEAAAIAVAAECPAAKTGALEIRPVFVPPSE